MSVLSAVCSGLVLGLVLVLGPGLASATYTYTKQERDGQTRSYDVKRCERFKGIPKGTVEQINCMENEGILEPWPYYVDTINKDVGKTDEILCRGQRGICASKYEYMTDLDNGCRQMMDGCRSALRHLQEMMMKRDPAEQVCNNFALKSVRGFFHDYMTKNIDGSVLSENNLEMNVGLCRWTQYINVLSDKTGCDAGSIIQMGGFLGYEACGLPLWAADTDVKPYVRLNGGMSCKARSTGEDAFPKKNSHALFDKTSGQRLPEFNDVTISADSALQEKFWCSVNPHSCATGDNARSDGLTDGEVEYSGDAAAAAHVIGRVTCPVTGHDLDGNTPKITQGFFHLPRTAETKAIGMDALQLRVQEGYQHLRETQCGESADYPGSTSDGKVPTGGVRVETDKWPFLDGETNLNTVGGLCGMPTQFLKTVAIGSRHRVPRFMNIAAESRLSEQTQFQQEQCTDNTRTMYIPLDLLTLRTAVKAPTSPALDRFLAIAWDGVGTIHSAWDTCVVGCDIDVMKNRICGGEGLQDFTWEGVDPCDGVDCGSNGKCDDNGTCNCSNGYKGDLCQIAPENCRDGIKNGQEVDVDCGGPDCAACTVYRWFVGEWGDCPVSCGGGFRQRVVRCEESQKLGVALPHDLCEGLELHPPIEEEKCGMSECGSYKWEYTDWTDCNTVCGGGTETRGATCHSSLVTAPVSDSFCDDGEKGQISRVCNTEICDTFHWFTVWDECDKTCGGGQQRSTSTCRDKNKLTASDSQCNGGETILSTRACNEAGCPVVQGEWTFCPWDACTTECGGSGSTMAGSQSRIVLCRDAITHAVTDPAVCSEDTRPREILAGCNPTPCTAPYYMTTAWSGCSDAKKTRFRTVHCHDTDGENVLNSVCENTGVPAPKEEEACEVNKCPFIFYDSDPVEVTPVNLATATTAWPAAIFALAATLRVLLELI